MNQLKPSQEVVRSTQWIAAAVALIAAMAFAYAHLFAFCFHEWLKPEYSHGFLVPLFSAFLLYRTRKEAPDRIRWPDQWGLALIGAGSLLFLIGVLNIGKEWIQGLSLVVNLAGAAVLLGGWVSLKWAGPAIGFLIFMFPLPKDVETTMGGFLQVQAARASAFVIQILGYPTYREGVILHVKDHSLEVKNACSGLSMLLTFIALSVAMSLVVRRPWLDRAVLLIASIPVAIMANVLRIALTGVLYNEAGRELGDRVFHDFAGWLMMPIALGLLWLILKLFDWIFVPDLGQASREEVLRTNANPALLFMHAIPGADVGKPGKPAKPAATAGKTS